MNRRETDDVLIIGGGVGGLFTGALLSKEGFRVTVLEKNATPGGGLQTFRRFGQDFDTGMHVVGGMEIGGNVRRICDYLGISERVQLQPVDATCSDSSYFAEDGATFCMSEGREAFVERLSSYFPHERAGISAYVSRIYEMVDGIDLFNLRPSPDFLTLPAADGLMAADEFVAQFTTDRRLRSVLAYINPFYGGRGGQTPAYIHAIIHVLYINGTQRFVGGSVRFAKLLQEVIEAAGGQVVCGDGVEWVEVKDRQVQWVRTRSGRIYQASRYVGAIHPCTLLSITSNEAFPRAYRTRLHSIPNAYSAFSLYIKLRPQCFPYVNHGEYYMSRYDDIWSFGSADKPWPLGFMMMTPPVEGQGPWSEKVLVTAPMSFELVRQWEDTRVGHRGSDYECWKQERTEQLLELMEVLHPGFSNCIEAVNASSPLTIRDFYGVKEGALSGFSKDCKNITLSQLPVLTKVRNLLLTGQCNRLHGFCGVPLTAINTCEAMLGQNYIINKINGQ